MKTMRIMVLAIKILNINSVVEEVYVKKEKLLSMNVNAIAITLVLSVIFQNHLWIKLLRLLSP